MFRRNFLKNSIIGSLSASTIMSLANKNNPIVKSVPRIISTWKHGVNANKIAWKKLNNGEGGLTAVEYGVRDSAFLLENNINVTSCNRPIYLIIFKIHLFTIIHKLYNFF